jgi:hypothetical protein
MPCSVSSGTVIMTPRRSARGRDWCCRRPDPSHGGLPALMDDSASQELWRHARSNILIVNPDAPGTLTTLDDGNELASRAS